MSFNFGDSVDINAKIISKKAISIHIPVKSNIDYSNPLFAECNWMAEKYERLKLNSKHGFNPKENFYEIQDDNNNHFQFQTKRNLGEAGDSIRLNKCRVKAKKTLNDGKVIFVLANGSQKQYEAYRNNTR